MDDGAPADCSRCPRLVASRQAVVNGLGPLPARVLVVAQNPGREEERVGYPLAERGWSGSRVREVLLPLANLSPNDVRFENVVRCRPPRGKGGDLPPTRGEIENCAAYLQAVIDRCRPEFIIALGAPAFAWFLPEAKLGIEHGRHLPWSHGGQDISVIGMYHPASAHPARNPGLAEVIMDDWRRLGEFITGKAGAALGRYKLVERDTITALIAQLVQEEIC